MILKEWNLRGRKVQIAVCDLTQEDVDAIVNAANENLKHGGGVALAIVRAGGWKIQEESDELVRTRGPVPTGEAAVTSAGNLKARYVIHAVGPVWRGGKSGEDELLFRAVYNALLRGHELGIRSISMPAISTGIFGFPKERAAGIFGKAIRKFLEEHPDTTLELIRICHLSRENGEIFAKHMEM